MTATAQRIPILMYHRVGIPDHAEDIYCIRPEDFSAQMAALHRANWRAVSVEDFDRWRQGEITLPENSFVLTFDDGFTGVHDFAAPVLQNLDWPATLFLVAGKLGSCSDWEVTLRTAMPAHPLMDASQLRALAAQGFSLHSHSLLHHDLTQLDPEHVERDLDTSRSRIGEITGQPPAYLAYPYGRHNEAVCDAARRAGFKLAFSVKSGFNRPTEHPYQIRRLDVFGTDTPAMLLRKIRLGVNDGSLGYLIRYYLSRILRPN